MSKNSLAKYYQNNKGRLKKRLLKGKKIYPKIKKKKGDNMVAKFSLKTKNEG